MKKVIRKLFWVWQFEDEEKWLNQMAQDGWALCDVGFCRYTFEQCQKGEYTFKLELLANHTGHSESVKYINFITDTGAEYIGNVLRWVYFRQKTTNGKFELLSTRATRIKFFERVCSLFSGFAIANGLIGVSNLLIALCSHSTGNLLGIINIALAAVLWHQYKIMNKRVQRLVEEKRVFED